MQNEDKSYRWEGDYEKTWEALREDESGSLQASIQNEINKAKRRRLQLNKKSTRLGMMRHIYVIVDMSDAMLEKDMKPNRFIVAVQLLLKFCEEFFDQNPIGQIGIISTSNKRAQVLSEMSGTLHKHKEILKKMVTDTIANNGKACVGEPSLQNSLELASKVLKHLPGHTSREILIIMGSLTTCDPGQITDTITDLKTNNIRCSVIGLSAEVHVCKRLANTTKGSYGIILEENHFKDLLLDHVTPPSSSFVAESSLLKMGFPHHISSTSANKPSMCMTTKKISIGGYYCPQCQAKYSNLPVQCVVCGLTLVSAPHLARSYHHLFPLPDFEECTAENFEMTYGNRGIKQCQSCQVSINKSAVYECQECNGVFCIDCYLFIREVLHSCSGCMNKND